MRDDLGILEYVLATDPAAVLVVFLADLFRPHAAYEDDVGLLLLVERPCLQAIFQFQLSYDIGVLSVLVEACRLHLVGTSRNDNGTDGQADIIAALGSGDLVPSDKTVHFVYLRVQMGLDEFAGSDPVRELRDKCRWGLFTWEHAVQISERAAQLVPPFDKVNLESHVRQTESTRHP